MKKTPLILSAIVVAVGAVYVGGAWYCGGKTEATLAARAKLLQGSSGLLKMVSYDYQRGLFSSTETLSLRVSPQHLANAGQFLPDRIKTLLDSPVIIHTKVRHSLWGAKADSTFEFSGEQQKIIKQLFGETVPFAMTDRMTLSGSGSLKFTISPFDYEELSGIQIKWQGLTSVTDYQPLYTEYKTAIDNPGFSASLTDIFSASYDGLKYQSHSLPSDPLPTGSTNFSLQKVAMHWNRDKVDYKIRLNEVVRMVSGLQVGGFINPSISILPPDVGAENIHFSVSSHLDNHYLSGEGRLSFARLNYGDEVYGPLNVAVQGEHLNAEALVAIADSVMNDQTTNADEWRNEVLQTLRGKGAALFTDNPKFTLSTFDLTTPSGKTSMNGSFALNGVVVNDLNDFSAIMPKAAVELKYQIPQAVIESFAHSQIQNLFDVEDQKNVNEIQETVRLMMNNMIADMQQKGYLKVENGLLSGDIVLNKGQLLLSGKAVDTSFEPDDESLFEDEEEECVEGEECEEDETTPEQTAQLDNNGILKTAAQQK
ncbi:MAG: YdgA family protein [Neisseriaceae bacterium]|nr:YdgA family protein [Neisseriaceae bacterium]